MMDWVGMVRITVVLLVAGAQGTIMSGGNLSDLGGNKTTIIKRRKQGKFTRRKRPVPQISASRELMKFFLTLPQRMVVISRIVLVEGEELVMVFELLLSFVNRIGLIGLVNVKKLLYCMKIKFFNGQA